jgi:hypothetical protein
VFNGPPPPVVERKINNNNKSVDFVKRAFEVIIPNQGKNPNSKL